MKQLHDRHDDGPQAERLKRDMPVLFHLLDVSRQRSAAVAPASPTHASESFPTQLLAPAIERMPATFPVYEPQAAEVPPAAPIVEAVAIVEPPVIQLPTAPTVAAAVSAATPTFSLDRPIELQMAPPALAEPTPAESNESHVVVEALHTELSAAVEHPVTPRPSFDTKRHFRIPFSEDWFAAHGRYIAVVFVIALVGTIYLARTNRRPARLPIETLPTVDVRPSVSTSAIPLLAANPPANASGGASSSAKDPPKLVEATSAVAETRTELHAPSATEVAARSDGAEKSADSLFVFPAAKKADERVATRPDSPQVISNPTMMSPAPPAAQAPPAFTSAPAQGMTFPPQLAPAYPTTAAPPVSYPATVPPQHAYPTTAAPALQEATGPALPPRFAPGQGPANMTGQAPAYQPAYPQQPTAPAYQPAQQPVYPTTGAYQSYQPPAGQPGQPAWQPPSQPASAAQAAAAQGTWQPPTAGGWSPPAPSAGMPPQYQSPNNTASGFRNERTGSSVY